jgi:hypothetical protein
VLESTGVLSAFLPYEPKLCLIYSMFFLISAVLSFLLLTSLLAYSFLVYLWISLLAEGSIVSAFCLAIDL